MVTDESDSIGMNEAKTLISTFFDRHIETMIFALRKLSLVKVIKGDHPTSVQTNQRLLSPLLFLSLTYKYVIRSIVTAFSLFTKHLLTR